MPGIFARQRHELKFLRFWVDQNVGRARAKEETAQTEGAELSIFMGKGIGREASGGLILRMLSGFMVCAFWAHAL
jgi:hypothetical protein